MYTQSARVYDIIYGKNDYPAQAKTLVEIIRQHEMHPSQSLLDVGCGTGLHLEQVQNTFTVAGVDLVPEMLEIARGRLPGAVLQQGDMRTFDLGQQFDVVTCLFSAIGYMLTQEDLTAALRNFAAHCTPGGLVIVEPWLHPENVRPPRLYPQYVEQDGLAVVRMNRSRLQDRLLIFDFHYMVGTDEGVETFVENHTLANYTDAEYRTAFAEAGLEIIGTHEGFVGRGLYIASRR